MSNPSIADKAKVAQFNSKNTERDWWNSATDDAKEAIMNEVDYADFNATFNRTALEAYQKDIMAKDYDTLPEAMQERIHEFLVVEGELPNPPSGFGQLYEVEGNNVMVECDRCGESFITEADFDDHKKFDHGDEPESFDQVEETYTLSMNPDVSKESLRNARRHLAEVEQKTLGDLYFNGSDIKTPNLTNPKAKVKQGYIDNPNQGLYDTKQFVKAPSTKRHDALESFYGRCEKCGGALFKTSEATIEVGGELVKNSFECNNCHQKYTKWYYKLTSYDDGNALANNTGYESHANEYYIGQPIKLKCDHCNWEWKSKIKDAGGNYDKQCPACSMFAGFPKEGGESYANGGETELQGEPLVATIDPMDQENRLQPNQIAQEKDDVDYDESQTLSTISNVKSEKEDDIRTDLDNVDFSEEAVEYVYPTKASESYKEEKDPFLEDYGDDDIETDEEALENQIIDRKLNGFSAETIANELRIKYGFAHEVALQKVYAVEVSTNDMVANTFFGKRFAECNEAEIREIQSYSGDTQ